MGLLNQTLHSPNQRVKLTVATVIGVIFGQGYRRPRSLPVRSAKQEGKGMDVFWQSFFGFLEKLALSVIPLIAALVAWRLSQKSYVKQLKLDDLKKKFDAFREIKSVMANIPPDLTKEDLLSRVNNDNEFRSSLTHRLIRLFGLRNELIPFLPPEIAELVDLRFVPLFKIENGTYLLKPDKITQFAQFADEARMLMPTIEAKSVNDYKKHLK